MGQTLDTQAMQRAVKAEVEGGLTACQIAVARNGEIAWAASLGSARPTTRFWIASATKPFVSAAVCLLIGEGKLDVSLPVAAYAPEFAANGKQDVTLEQVLLMTCGFPDAPMRSADGADPARRIAQLASWPLDWAPGTQYAYHGESAHWVLAEIIERVTGQPYCDFFEERITRPLGLPRMLGIPRAQQADMAQLSDAADETTRTLYDYAAKVEAGEPGGGILSTASNVALLYQGLLNNPGEMWAPAALRDAVENVRCTLPDPQMGLPANRTLAAVRGAGFGSIWGQSKTAFGWTGVGGQVGFAEPATGISFAFLQMGDNDQTSQFIRVARLAALALELGR